MNTKLIPLKEYNADSKILDIKDMVKYFANREDTVKIPQAKPLFYSTKKTKLKVWEYSGKVLSILMP